MEGSYAKYSHCANYFALPNPHPYGAVWIYKTKARPFIDSSFVSFPTLYTLNHQGYLTRSTPSKHNTLLNPNQPTMPLVSTLLTYSLLSLLSLTASASTIYKGDGTFYSPSVGFGSCGRQNADTDHVAALAVGSMRLYNPSNPNNNPLCGHKVKVWEQGKPANSVVVAIEDTCPGCHGEYDLDLSPAAFNKLAKPEGGRIKIAWEFEEPVTLKTGPFAGAVPGKKVAVQQKVVTDSEAGESRDEL